MLWLLLLFSLAINACLFWRAWQWRAYGRALAAKRSSEVEDTLKAARRAGLDPARCTLVRDGGVVYSGANVSERTKARVSAPPPAVVRNAP